MNMKVLDYWWVIYIDTSSSSTESLSNVWEVIVAFAHEAMPVTRVIIHTYKPK